MENNEWNQACQEVFKNGSEYNKIQLIDVTIDLIYIMTRQPPKHEIVQTVIHVLKQIIQIKQLHYIIDTIIDNIQNIDEYLQKHLSQETIDVFLDLLMILIKYVKYQPSYQVYRVVCILILTQSNNDVKNKLIMFLTIKLNNDFQKLLNSNIQNTEQLNNWEIVYDLVVVYQQQLTGDNQQLMTQENINFLFYNLQLINSVNYDQQHEVLKLIKTNKKENEFITMLITISVYIQSENAVQRLISMLQKTLIQGVITKDISPVLSTLLIKIAMFMPCNTLISFLYKNFETSEDYEKIFLTFIQTLRQSNINQKLDTLYFCAKALKAILESERGLIETYRYIGVLNFILQCTSSVNEKVFKTYEQFEQSYDQLANQSNNNEQLRQYLIQQTEVFLQLVGQ